jgi:hypothetical protein
MSHSIFKINKQQYSWKDLSIILSASLMCLLGIVLFIHEVHQVKSNFIAVAFSSSCLYYTLDKIYKSKKKNDSDF